MNPTDVFLEIVKEAGPAHLARYLTDRVGRTAVLGAAAGAAHGVATRQEGESGWSAGVRGALRGGALAGGVAAVGRGYRDTRLLDPTASAGGAVVGTLRRAGQGIKRFGQRQLHGFTGSHTGKPGAIGMRSSEEAGRRIDLLEKRFADEAAHAKSMGKSTDALKRELADSKKELQQWGQRGDAADAAGITSIPGVVKGLIKKPGATAKALKDEVVGGSNANAMMAVGVPVAFAAPEVLRGDESAEGGRTVGQKLRRLGGNIAGGVATAGLPFAPQILAGGALESASGISLRRKPKAPGGSV